MENKIFNYKFITANKASSYPYLFTKISKLLSGRDCYTTKDTDIVIDGFPRSANTYATYAFDVAQSKKYNIANHIHKKSQFLIAHNYGIPCILLIRRPIDCISSLLIRQPKYDPAVAFEGYYFLYNGLKHLDSYVVGNFENVLDNYGEIINKVNFKFGCTFNLYVKNKENEEKVKHIIQTQDELINAKDYKQRVAYPTEERQNSGKEIKKILQQKQYESLHKKCEELYLDLIHKN